MAEKQVIQEFLAVLGFQVSQPSLKSFLSSLKLSCIAAGKLGATLAGVAVAAETMVTVFAKNMEKMFYLSQRTGASVGSLRALSFAFGQVGLTSEEALDTVDEFAKRMRYEPGKFALFQQLVGGSNEKDPIKQFKMLMLRLREMTKSGAGFIAVQWAEAFGVSEKVFNRMMQPGAIEAIGQAERKAGSVFKNLGIDQERAARASRDFMNELRELWLIVESIGAKFAIDLLPYIRAFNQAILEFGRDLVQSGLEVAIDNQLKKLGSWGEALKRVKDWAMPVLREAGKAMAQFADDFSKFGMNQAVDNALVKMGSFGKVLGLIKDLIMVLPKIPDMVAQLVNDLFGPDASQLTGGSKNELDREQHPIRSALSNPFRFQGNLLDAASTMMSGARSQTFAPKTPWWSNTSAAMAAPGGQRAGGVIVSQDIDIHLGSTDPREAGRSVRTELGRVASDTARTYGSVPR